MNLGDKSYL